MSETVQPIVHEIWRPLDGRNFKGRKIAVVGYSHYHGEGQEDRPSLTQEVVSNVISGAEKHTFFRKIRDAFGSDSHQEFWSGVYFFNYLPRSVGTKDKMYATGTEAEIEEAQNRFLDFLERERPEKVFVFTRKGWKSFPECTTEELGGGVCNVLLDGSRTNWGRYQVGSAEIHVCGFQHPQYANAEQLRAEVQAFLAL